MIGKQTIQCPTCGNACVADYGPDSVSFGPLDRLPEVTGNKTLVGLADELHRRLHIQARNLLFEYKFAMHSAGYVPTEKVENLMRTYGYLITQLIFEDQQKAYRDAEIVAKKLAAKTVGGGD